jgi:hypothetical protein
MFVFYFVLTAFTAFAAGTLFSLNFPLLRGIRGYFTLLVLLALPFYLSLSDYHSEIDKAKADAGSPVSFDLNQRVVVVGAVRGDALVKLPNGSYYPILPNPLSWTVEIGDTLVYEGGIFFRNINPAIADSSRLAWRLGYLESLY